MPTVMTHAIVGLTAGACAPFARRAGLFWFLSAALPMAPDLDVVGLALGVPFLSMWGHRGISHSIAAAVIIGAVTTTLTYRRLGVPPLSLGVYFALITASHGVFDALTDGGPGVAFFAPFDDARIFLPWRPLPVSPLAARFFSAWGWLVFRAELTYVWIPALVITAIALAARRRRQ